MRGSSTGAAALVALLTTSSATAQQPFVVDDAAVVSLRTWQVEISVDWARLPEQARPVRRQASGILDVVFGVAPRAEISFTVPFTGVFYEPGLRRSSDAGIGDTSLALKVAVHENTSRTQAVALTASLELPTGDREREIGSGLVDFTVAAIWQRRMRGAVLHAHGVVVAAGNTQDGAAGIRARGTVLAGGLSIVRPVSRRLQLGAEIWGARSASAVVGGSTLHVQGGGNYAMRTSWFLDFAILAGWYEAPAAGVVLGTTVDF
jgi:hypothetical protein